MAFLRRPAASAFRNVAISSGDGTTPTVSSVTRRKRASSPGSGVHVVRPVAALHPVVGLLLAGRGAGGAVDAVEVGRPLRLVGGPALVGVGHDALARREQPPGSALRRPGDDRLAQLRPALRLADVAA